MKNKNYRMLLPVASLAGFLFTTPTVHAASLLITNPSFETDVITNPGDSSPANITGWTDLGGDPGYGRTAIGQFPSGAPDGVNYAYTNTAADTLSQTLTSSLEADTTYTLTVATGWRADLPGAGYPNYPGYKIELWAGGNLLATDSAIVNGGTGVGPTIGTWKDVTATYTSPSTVTPGQFLEVRLLAGATVNGTSAIQTNYDNVRLVSVPEPSSTLLLGLGTLFLLRRRR
jgi:PEP-CTERM motif